MNIEKFETPVLEVEEIETKDVITASFGDNDESWMDSWNQNSAYGRK